jgi:hypothetical protein
VQGKSGICLAGTSASKVILNKVTNSVGEDITDKFRAYAKNNDIDLSQKEALETAAGKFAKEFVHMPWLP